MTDESLKIKEATMAVANGGDEITRLKVENQHLRNQIARLQANHNLATLEMREELILSKCQLESVLAILRRTYDDIRDQQSRRAETKRD